MSGHNGPSRLRKRLGETRETQNARDQKTGPRAPESASILSIGLKIQCPLPLMRRECGDLGAIVNVPDGRCATVRSRLHIPRSIDAEKVGILGAAPVA